MIVADKYLPRIARTERCHPSFPAASCSGRRESVKRGEFYWDWSLGGWVSLFNPLRTQSGENNWKSGVSTHGLPYILEIRPFCGSALPELKAPHIVDDDGRE